MELKSKRFGSLPPLESEKGDNPRFSNQIPEIIEEENSDDENKSKNAQDKDLFEVYSFSSGDEMSSGDE